MEIKEVRLDRTFNLGNYQSIKIGLTASVGPEDDPQDILKVLDQEAHDYRNSFEA